MTMTPEELKAIRQSLPSSRMSGGYMSQQEFSQLVGFSMNTIATYETGGRRITPRAEFVIRAKAEAFKLSVGNGLEQPAQQAPCEKEKRESVAKSQKPEKDRD